VDVCNIILFIRTCTQNPCVSCSDAPARQAMLNAGSSGDGTISLHGLKRYCRLAYLTLQAWCRSRQNLRTKLSQRKVGTWLVTKPK
jgi:hypothetical protein